MTRLAIALLALAACGKKPENKPAAETTEIKVAAASDLMFAFKDVGDAFEKQTGKHVTFSFGSSGNLAKQIANGAPFDVFAAANAAFVDEAVTAGACDGATKAMYARGRIVVWTKTGGPAAPASLADLEDERFKKIAIANPEHAPYGKAAKQALEKLGIWDAVRPKIVFGRPATPTRRSRRCRSRSRTRMARTCSWTTRCTHRSTRRWSRARTVRAWRSASNSRRS
jgi:molybdate transport system substrate-binding protein